METIDCIKTRRSRRLFLNKEIPENIISKLIKCAINSPSSRDCQPWHFIIVKDKEIKEKLAELKGETNQQHILTSYISIVVCIDNEKSSRYIEDGAIAAQTILLTAHDLGLGAVYVTGFKPDDPEIAKEIKTTLNLPENIMPVTIIPIGYIDSSEELKNKELLKIDEVIHYNQW